MTEPKSYPTQPLGLTGWTHPTAPLEVEITYVDTDVDSRTLSYEAHFRVKADNRRGVVKVSPRRLHSLHDVLRRGVPYTIAPTELVHWFDGFDGHNAEERRRFERELYGEFSE